MAKQTQSLAIERRFGTATTSKTANLKQKRQFKRNKEINLTRRES
jgi:hypothetical protein